MKTYQFGSLLATQRQSIVRLVPLPEGGTVHQNHTVFHQGFGSDQLIVGGIVDHINDPGLTGAACNHQQTWLIRPIHTDEQDSGPDHCIDRVKQK